MRTIAMALTLGALIPTTAIAPGKPAVQRPQRLQVASTCFSTGEQSSGMTKICYYDCLGSPAAITISSTSLCPLTINR